MYSDASYYFVTTDAGDGEKITDAADAITGHPNATSTTFDDYDFHEKNKYNFLKSGRQWFGERIEYSAFDTTFIFADLVTTSAGKVKGKCCKPVGQFKNLYVSATTIRSIGSIAVSCGNPQQQHRNLCQSEIGSVSVLSNR